MAGYGENGLYTCQEWWVMDAQRQLSPKEEGNDEDQGYVGSPEQ